MKCYLNKNRYFSDDYKTKHFKSTKFKNIKILMIFRTTKIVSEIENRRKKNETEIFKI